MPTDARDLCPSHNDGNPYYLYVFKNALVQQFGIDDGFRIYREMLPPQAPYESRPHSIERKRVESLRAYAMDRSAVYEEVYPSGELYAISPPRTIGPAVQRELGGTARAFYVACIENAVVHGRAPFIEAGGVPLRDFEPHELERIDDRWAVDPYVFAAEGRDVWRITNQQPVQHFDEAFVSLLGVSNRNFGHWLWEYLPKIVAAVESQRLPRVPVLIDAGMPATHREALEMMLPEGMPIHEITPEPAIHVARAWCAPSLPYAPLLEVVNAKYNGPDYLATVPARFAAVVRAMARRTDSLPPLENAPERLYLARKPHRWTKMTNYSEIEAVARARDFTIVYPEDHSFADQVRYAAQARYVLGPEGSTMYLPFFCKSGARLCTLIHPFTIELQTNTYPMTENGIDVTYFTGPAMRLNDAPEHPTFGYPHHADYEIDAGALEAFLDEWLES